MAQTVPARIRGYFAKNAPACIIVRRGPTRYSQMIRWETDTDRCEPGQWVHGKVHYFTMTSDGRHAAIGIMGARSRLHSWEDTQMAFVCRPPYFTALEIVIGGLCYTYTAFLPDDRLMVYGQSHMVHALNECPFVRITSEDVWPVSFEHDYLIDARHGPATGTVQQGREILMADGKIFAVEGGRPRLLFDCNDCKFEKVAPPDWALRW